MLCRMADWLVGARQWGEWYGMERSFSLRSQEAEMSIKTEFTTAWMDDGADVLDAVSPLSSLMLHFWRFECGRTTGISTMGRASASAAAVRRDRMSMNSAGANSIKFIGRHQRFLLFVFCIIVDLFFRTVAGDEMRTDFSHFSILSSRSFCCAAFYSLLINMLWVIFFFSPEDWFSFLLWGRDGQWLISLQAIWMSGMWTMNFWIC